MNRPETPEEIQTRLALEARTVNIGRALKSTMPKNVGFALVMYDFGAAGSMAYTGSGNRADTVKMLEELLVHLRSGE